MAEAVVLREYGGSDVMNLETVALADLNPTQIRIRQTGIGVNFHDVYVRSGSYQTLPLPGIPGCEATGIIEEMGDDVVGMAIGDRVAYVTGLYGGYASERVLDARLALPIPDGLPDELVATNLLRAMTVDMLLSKVAQVQSGDTILVQAAAGGVGRLLCQWASNLGVTVIGTVGSLEKSARAMAAGCAQTIIYTETDFVAAVEDLTDGQGVDVVFDSVGGDTFYGSLETLKFTGHLVNFGQSSGPVTPLQMTDLAAKSLTVSRPILFHYFRDEGTYRQAGSSVFEAFQSGILSVEDVQKFPLAEAATAHDLLEARLGGGSIMLTV